jgi:uncharacterized protein (TIGR02996 family)
MTDGEALLETVLDNPDDDVPRLIYADWLEETGQPVNIARAEFIRLQCHIGIPRSTHALWLQENGEMDRAAEYVKKCDFAREKNLPVQVGTADEVVEWLLRSDDLLQEFAPKWVPFVPKKFHIQFFRWVRGFIRWVMVYQEKPFYKFAPKLFSNHPVEKVDLFGNIRSWRSKDRPRAVLPIASFVKEYRASSLTSLHFQWFSVDPTLIVELARTKTLPKLNQLEFALCPFTSNDVLQLVSGPLSKQIKSLSLIECGIDDIGGEYLAQARTLVNLEKLNLRGNRFSDSTEERLRQRFGEKVQF